MVDIRLANHGTCPLRVAMMIGSTGCLEVEAAFPLLQPCSDILP
jgi:hypothetical protein